MMRHDVPLPMLARASAPLATASRRLPLNACSSIVSAALMAHDAPDPHAVSAFCAAEQPLRRGEQHVQCNGGWRVLASEDDGVRDAACTPFSRSNRCGM